MIGKSSYVTNYQNYQRVFPNPLIQVALHEWRPGEPLEARQPRPGSPGPNASAGAAAAAAAAGAKPTGAAAAVLGAGETEP